ncbi:MAG: GNAT family N-acetyltransferase [Propionibacteriaceae bacterium]|nr:GNAT family N-acetyltransferase [Propionibacteriaceae bacterium]
MSIRVAPQPDDTRIRLVTEDRKRFIDLLLLADEQEDMIDEYLDRGDLFVMDDDTSAVAVCVVTNEGNGVFEVRNLAVRPDRQRQGYGQQMLRHVEAYYQGRARDLLVGTGDSPITVPFYEACGFTFDHRVPCGIADAYDHPIVEAGVRVIDKVYLRKTVDSAEVWDVLDVSGLPTGRVVKRDLDGGDPESNTAG